MIISERSNFIFIHNPKCAGTSVRKVLMEYDTTGEAFWAMDDWNGRRIFNAHMPLFIFRSRYPDYFKLLATHLTFMFVRHPYERSVSAFNELHPELAPKPDDPGSEAAYTMALNKFICDIKETSLRRHPLKYRHFLRQSDFAYLGTKCHADVIMKIEEWPHCLTKLAVFLPTIAEVIRSSEKHNVRPLARQHRTFLNPAAIKVINELYKHDFDLFGYDRIENAEPARGGRPGQRRLVERSAQHQPAIVG
jgi:hypothetical protein